MWFSLGAGINSKAVHNAGKEGVCGSSPASGRKVARVLSRWGAVGQVQAASLLPARLAGCDGEMAAGHGKQAEAAPAQQLPSPCRRPLSSRADRLHRALQLGFLPCKALPTPRRPFAWATILPTSPWHSMEGGGPARRGKEPGKGPGPAAFLVLGAAGALPWDGFGFP